MSTSAMERTEAIGWSAESRQHEAARADNRRGQHGLWAPGRCGGKRGLGLAERAAAPGTPPHRLSPITNTWLQGRAAAAGRMAVGARAGGCTDTRTHNTRAEIHPLPALSACRIEELERCTAPLSSPEAARPASKQARREGVAGGLTPAAPPALAAHTWGPQRCRARCAAGHSPLAARP